MPRRKWTGLNRVKKRRADGSVATLIYHRATNIRLPDDENAPEFVVAYAEAQKTIKARLVGDTFSAVAREYQASIEFGKLGAGTQREYKRMIKAAEVEFHDLPREALNDPAIKGELLDWREKVARISGEREADNRVSIVSAMLTWAVERGRIKANHVKGFTRLYHANRAEVIWLEEHVKAFMSVAPIELQRMMIIALHTGQRQGDLLRLPWSAYDGTVIQLRQSKSRRHGVPGRVVTIPCTAALKRMLDDMKRDRVSPLILTTKTGRAFQKRYFSKLWEATCIKAGLDKAELPNFEDPVALHFHDIRGTTITLLSEAKDTTPQQIAAITGHSLKTVTTILDRYLARTRALADIAIDNFENSPGTRFANELQTGPQARRTTKGKAVE